MCYNKQKGVYSMQRLKNVDVISKKEQKKKVMEEEMIRHLLKSEEDIEKGRVRDAEDVFKEWREKYGI